MIFVIAKTLSEANDFKRLKGLRGARTFSIKGRGIEGLYFTSEDTIHILSGAYDEKIWRQIAKAPTRPEVKEY